MTDVLFPIESTARELDYRLILAAHLARRGVKVLLGRSDVVQSASALGGRGGVYAGKEIFHLEATEQIAAYHRLKRRGRVVVHLDEEGAVHQGAPPQWRRIVMSRADPALFADDDVMCTWGERQAEWVRAERPAAEVVVTGHPRFDLPKPDHRAYFSDEVDRIRDRFPRYVLATTSWPDPNNAVGPELFFGLARARAAAGYQPRDESTSMFCHEGRALTRMIGLLRRVAHERPDLQLVVRPHPSDDLSLIRSCFDDLGNVAVEREGGLVPWLIAARLVVHGGSTAGIEAHLAETPVVYLESPDGTAYEKPLARAVGTVVRDPRGAIDAIDRALAGEPAPARQDPMLGLMIANAGPRDSMAALAELLATRAAARPVSRPPRAARLRALARAASRADDVERALFVVRGQRRRARYRESKFQLLTDRIVDERVRSLRRLLGAAPQIERLGPHLLLVH